MLFLLFVFAEILLGDVNSGFGFAYPVLILDLFGDLFGGIVFVQGGVVVAAREECIAFVEKGFVSLSLLQGVILLLSRAFGDDDFVGYLRSGVDFLGFAVFVQSRVAVVARE